MNQHVEQYQARPDAGKHNTKEIAAAADSRSSMQVLFS